MEKIEKLPDGITPALLEVVIMPNGEVIFLGKTVCWHETAKGFLFKHPSQD